MSGFVCSGAISPMQAVLSCYNHDQEQHDSWTGRYQWMYQLRHIRANREQYGFFNAWPRSRGMAGDPTAVAWLLGQDNADGGLYEPVSVWDGGSVRMSFVNGTVYDSTPTPVASVNLDMFLTGSDVWVATGVSDPNGIYSLGTPYVGVNHYVVANYNSNQMTGASRNDLVPVSNPWP